MNVPCKPLIDILNMVEVTGADSATIVPTDDGWEFYVRDPSNFMMVAATLRRKAFGEDYDEDMLPFAVPLEFLRETFAKRDNADMTVVDGFVIVTAGGSRSKRRLYALDETPRVFPKLKLRNSIAVNSDNLLELAKKRCWDKASGCDTGLEVKINDASLIFDFETESEGYAESIAPILSDMPDGTQTSHFTPLWFLPALRALPKGLPVVITMESDKPIIVTVDTEAYKIDIFVAPRIGE